MSDDQSANTTAESGPPRPPFNEVSVLFPLLTLYTVGMYGKRIPGRESRLP